MWCGCILGNLSGSSPVCGVVGPLSLLRVDPGHGTRCGPMLVPEPNVTTSHSTCCGRCVRDYHICFRLFAFVKFFRAHAVFERSTKGD